MMPGSSSRVPMVRCPKCGHLLPKLPPHSVYRCGNCNAYLQAEKGSSVDDALSENSSERIGEGFEREANETPLISARPRVGKSVRSRYGDGSVRKSNSGDSDANSNLSGRSDGVVRKAPLTEIGLDGHGKSPAASSVRQGFRQSVLGGGEFDEERSMGSEFVDSYEEMESRQKVGAWFDHVNEETGYANRVVAQNYEASVDESELNRSRVAPRSRRAEQFVGHMEPEYGDSYVRRRMEVPRDDWVHGDVRVRDEYVGSVRGSSTASSVRQRIPVYPDEVPLNYPPYYGYDHPRGYQESYVGSSSVQNLGMDRAELFDLYNDLKEKLIITGDLPENRIRGGHHRISSADYYGGPNEYVLDEPLRLRRPAASVDLDERTGMRPHYVNRNRLPVPPARFVQRPHPFHDEDPSWPQIPERRNFPPQRSPGHSVDSTYDSFGHRRRYPDYQNNAAADFPDQYGVQHPSGPRLPYNNHHGPSSHSRSSVGSKSDGGSSAKEVNKRIVAVDKNQVVCHPVIGAAPFVICYSCSQLLRLPRKLIALKNTQHTLQCGACHTTLSFIFKKKSHDSTLLQPKLNSNYMNDGPSNMSVNDYRKSHVSSVGNRESFDFDANGYTFPSTDSEPSMQLEDKMRNSFEAQKQQGLGPSSSNASKCDLDLNNAVGKTNKPPRPPPGSPLQEHLEYSAIFSLKRSDSIETDAQGYDLGITGTNRSSLNYVQNADEHADLEIGSNNVPNSDLSPSLGEASINNDEGGNKKGQSFLSGIAGSRRSSRALSPPHSASSTKDESFLPGIAGSRRSSKALSPPHSASSTKDESFFSSITGSRRSSKDMSPDHSASSTKDETFFSGITGSRRSSKDLSPPHNGLSKKDGVFVNGKPLSHREVKRAEKMAGPIFPGSYWYDSRAGFWGIVGNCCLGIIPPFIEEFGSPMPVDCAGGNTGICVNGRELHENDLELLSSRGFPRTSNKSYVIDISGKVEDEETGDVVARLGKLAPTVEKTGRGFGMQPPEMHED